jgi:hypothetical protein
MTALKIAPITTATANKPSPNGLGVGFLDGEGVSILAPHLSVRFWLLRAGTQELEENGYSAA